MGATRLDDGFSTVVTFSEDSGLELYIKEVTPPSIDSGGPNDTTTMHNTAWRTRAPKKLKTLSEMTVVGAYATDLYTSIVAMAGVNQLITVTFPDASTLSFWGFVDKLNPRACVEGEQPTVELVVVCSNQNDSQVETAPVVA